MEQWMAKRQFFLDELIRHDGLGDYHTVEGFSSRTLCGICSADYEDDHRMFRCTDCGHHLQCEACLRKGHQTLPLHSPMVRYPHSPSRSTI